MPGVTGYFYDRALAAAAQASTGTAELLRAAREDDEPYGSLIGEETIERLLDAAKLAIEASNADLGGDLGQVYAAIVKYLEGWAG
jgi:hypothetical protein